MNNKSFSQDSLWRNDYPQTHHPMPSLSTPNLLDLSKTPVVRNHQMISPSNPSQDPSSTYMQNDKAGVFPAPNSLSAAENVIVRMMTSLKDNRTTFDEALASYLHLYSVFDEKQYFCGWLYRKVLRTINIMCG